MSTLTYDFPETLPEQGPDGLNPTRQDHIRNMAEEFLRCVLADTRLSLIHELFVKVRKDMSVMIEVIRKAMNIVDGRVEQAEHTPPDYSASSIPRFPWSWFDVSFAVRLFEEGERPTYGKMMTLIAKNVDNDNLAIQIGMGFMVAADDLGYDQVTELRSIVDWLLETEGMHLARVFKIAYAIICDPRNKLKTMNDNVPNYIASVVHSKWRNFRIAELAKLISKDQ